MTSATVAFQTLGCKLNFSETSTLARKFVAAGYERVPFEMKADVYVINTCSVTENAHKKFKSFVLEFEKIFHLFIFFIFFSENEKSQ